MEAKRKTDYQLVAEWAGSTIDAVKAAVKRRDRYPDNRLYQMYKTIQDAKEAALKQKKQNGL